MQRFLLHNPWPFFLVLGSMVSLVLFFKDYLMAGGGAYQYQKNPQIQGKIGLNA